MEGKADSDLFVWFPGGCRPGFHSPPRAIESGLWCMAENCSFSGQDRNNLDSEGLENIIEKRIGKKAMGFKADVKSKRQRRIGWIEMRVHSLANDF